MKEASHEAYSGAVVSIFYFLPVIEEPPDAKMATAVYIYSTRKWLHVRVGNEFTNSYRGRELL